MQPTRSTRTRLPLFGALFLVLLPVRLVAQTAAAPSLMNFQGRLAKPDGTPVPDGTYSIRFRFFDALTGGTAKFDQTINPVTVRNGTFAVLLSGFPAGTFNSNLWLDIKIGSAASLTPRQQIVSVAYAMKANTVPDGSIGAAQIADGSITANKFASNLFNPIAWLLGGNSGTNGTQFLGTTDNQPLLFKTNNTERMRLLAGGNLGIGTNTPAELLTVYGGNLALQTSDNTKPQSILFQASGGKYNWRIYRNDAGNNLVDLRFAGGASTDQTLLSDKLTLTNSGNLGIGTTSPANTLSVVGNTDISGNLGIGTTSPTNPLSVTGNANFTGSVGIGTATPSNPLSVKGNANFTGSIGIGTTSPTNPLSIVGSTDISGRLGIGTTSPAYKLDVNGTGSFANNVGLGAGALSAVAAAQLPSRYLGIIGDASASNFPGAAGLALIHSSGNYFQMGINTDQSFSIYQGQTERVKIDTNGFLGLGSSTPQSALHLTDPSGITLGKNYQAGGYTALQISLSQPSNGNARIQAIKASGSSYGDLLLNPNGGNVGIGTFTPGVSLDVSGTVRASLITVTGGADVAEPFHLRDEAKAQPGMVVCIDAKHMGELKLASRPYDRAVAGILSGAHGIRPGMTLQQTGTAADGKHPVALSGRVWCWCDADANGPISPSDLLTTSSTPGHAMRATDRVRTAGAVLGKAMSSLKRGKGLVLVLVTLQ